MRYLRETKEYNTKASDKKDRQQWKIQGSRLKDIDIKIREEEEDKIIIEVRIAIKRNRDEAERDKMVKKIHFQKEWNIVDRMDNCGKCQKEKKSAF